MRMRFTLATLAMLAHPALAQDAETQRELVRRDQQSDAFNLQLRQSQERLNAPSGDVRRQQETEVRQLSERQRLEATSERQLQEAGRDTPADLRPQERVRTQQERRPLVEAQRPPALVPAESLQPLPMHGNRSDEDKSSRK